MIGPLLLVLAGLVSGEAAADSVRQEIRPSLADAHVPGRWSFLRSRVTNQRDEACELLSITTFHDPHRPQFGRRLWIPPRTRLVTSQPICIPDTLPDDPLDSSSRELELRSLLFDGPSSEHQLIRHASGELQIRDKIWFVQPGQVTGVLPPPEDRKPDASGGISLFDFVLTGRADHGVQHNLMWMEEGFPPGGVESLDGYDQLILAHDGVLHDRMAMTAIRRWLYAGGRLWVMLDQINGPLLEVLCGDESAVQVVDRVGLTSVHLQPERNRFVQEEQREFERPVALVRLLVEGVEVAYTTGGWPAAFWKDHGQGRLLVTTLGRDAWVRPRRPTDLPPRTGKALMTSFVPGPAYDDLVAEFFVPRSDPLVEQEILEAQVRENIGYTVPSKGLVVGMLGGFCVVLIALGGWLLRRGEAQRLGVFAPVAALAVNLSLMAVGKQHRSIPEMTAVTQLVQPIPGTHDVIAIGSAAMLRSEPGQTALSGDGGWLLPDVARQDVGTRRIVWSGLDHWSWENLPLAQGVHTANFRNSARMNSRVTVQARFDAEGISGRLTLPDGLTPSDAIVATPLGRIGVETEEDGAFHARAENMLSADQYFTAGLISDQQSQRGRTLSALFKVSRHRSFPSRPTLLFWTDPWDFGTAWPSASSVVGSALVMLPLVLERPAVGTTVRIPSCFVTYQEALGPGEEFFPGIYNHRTGDWLEKDKPISAWLRFRLPEGLAPAQSTAARLTIRVVGPMQRLAVAGLQEGRTVPITTWNDPVGTMNFDIDDPELIALAPDGTLMLRIAVGDPEQPIKPDQPIRVETAKTPFSSSFRIESLALEVQATLLKDNPSP